MVFLSFSLSADPAQKEARKGVEAYKQKQLDKALDSFQKAGELDPNSAAIQYDLGTTLAEKKQFPQATDALTKSLNYQGTSSPRDSFFNLGYSRVMEAQSEGEKPKKPEEKVKALRAGLDAFRQAILADPSDKDAKYNFETTKLILRNLEEQMQQQQQQQSQNDQKQKQNKNQKNQGQGPSDQNQQKGQDEQNKNQRQEGNEKQNQQQQQQSGEQKEDKDKQNSEQNRQDQGKQSDEPKDQKKQQGGLEATPTPASQNQAKQAQSSSEAGQSQDQPQEPTPQQLDALRLLNSLTKDKPEQFKKLFQFQGRGSSKRLERDW